LSKGCFAGNVLFIGVKMTPPLCRFKNKCEEFDRETCFEKTCCGIKALMNKRKVGEY